MAWIDIDADQGVSIGRMMVDSGHRSMSALDRLRALAGAPGLGQAHGEVEAQVLASASQMSRALLDYLEVGVEMTTRLRVLLDEQATASVIGHIVSPAAVIAGTAIVGGVLPGFSAGAASAVSVIGGGSAAPGVAAGGPPSSVTIGGSAPDSFSDPLSAEFEAVFSPRGADVLGEAAAPLSVSSIPDSMTSRVSIAELNRYPDLLVPLSLPPAWPAKVLADAMEVDLF